MTGTALTVEQEFSWVNQNAKASSIEPRLKQLLANLPTLYAMQPPNGGIAGLLRVMASMLTQLDQDMERVLHDRWVALATGQTYELGVPSALERLGHLLQVKRLVLRTVRQTSLTPQGLEVHFASSQRAQEACALVQEKFPALVCTLKEDEKGQILSIQSPKPNQKLLESVWVQLQLEPDEKYRQRLATTAPILLKGLTTPRALLSLAIADLGAVPCVQMEKIQDATVAWGIPPELHEQCSVCEGKSQGKYTSKKQTCPYRERAVIKTWLLENPLRTLSKRAVVKELGERFTVHNPSLCVDRPTIKIKSLATEQQGLSNYYLGLQNQSTGETILFKQPLGPEQTLTLLPECIPWEGQAFQSYSPNLHHAWQLTLPQGRATLTTPLENGKVKREDVSKDIAYIAANRFNQATARFVGRERVQDTRFGLNPQRVRTPKLVYGDNDWAVVAFPFFEWPDPIEQILNHPNGLRAAALPPVEIPLPLVTPSHPSLGFSLVVEMEWVARLPATLCLCIPENGWVNNAREWGALDLVRNDLEQIRAAGTRAWVEWTQPILQEQHDSNVGLPRIQLQHVWKEANDLGDAMQGFTKHEENALSDGLFTIQGRLGSTRWDWSRFW